MMAGGTLHPHPSLLPARERGPDWLSSMQHDSPSESPAGTVLGDAKDNRGVDGP